MRYVLAGVALVGLVAIAHAGDEDSWWNIDDARMAAEIEMKVAEDGRHEEIEYHIDPSRVPAAVHKAMSEMYPGLTPTAAEKEWAGGKLYYELSVVKDGKKVEAMFTPEGEIHSQEIQVDVSTVPQPVQDVIKAKYGGCTITQWEVIKGPDGKLVEYHVKLTEEGKKHKVLVTERGDILGAYFEVPGEFEIPAPKR